RQVADVRLGVPTRRRSRDGAGHRVLVGAQIGQKCGGRRHRAHADHDVHLRRVLRLPRPAGVAAGGGLWLPVEVARSGYALGATARGVRRCGSIGIVAARPHRPDPGRVAGGRSGRRHLDVSVDTQKRSMTRECLPAGSHSTSGRVGETVPGGREDLNRWWGRIEPVWHLLYAGLLALVTLTTWLTGSLDTAQRWTAMVLLTAMAALYALVG